MIRLRSVRFQILAAVNIAIALLLGIFLILDYRREIVERIAEKHVALEEETKTLLPAVVRIQPYGQQAVQDYIDDVCGSMWDALSPGHHIAVRLGDTVLQAVAHHRASPEIFEAMQAAAQSPQHRAGFGDRELVVGISQKGDAIVYISEYLSAIRQTARTQTLRRLPWIVLLMAVTAMIVNVVFLRVAARPLKQLVDTVRKIGDGQLGTRVGPFQSEEFQYLAGEINSMSSSLAETEQRRRAEMDRARDIQEQLLPDETTARGLEFAHLYRPADDVAGDYFDMISLPSGACLVCIADVAGHGVPAALSAAMLKAYLQDASEHHTDPGEILRTLNYRLAVVSPTENFATMCVAVVDSDRETLHYASAGHETGFILKNNGQLVELPSTGLVLGITDKTEWTTETMKVGPGDRLLLVTDGVTEAMDQQDELFGRKRLADSFRECGSINLEQAIKRIGDTVSEYSRGNPQTDDVTLLAFEISKPPLTERTRG